MAAGSAPGGHLPTGDGLAELLLRALGVPGVEHVHHHRGLQLLNGQLEELGGILLVVLDGHMDAVHAEYPGQDAGSAHHRLRVFHDQPVVAGDVGLALAGVENDRVHLAQAGADFYMGGEGGPAHAHDAAVLHQG